MAGILANSASVTMVSGTVDNTQSGFVLGEAITLSTTPTGTDYSWGLAKPSGASSRSDLSDDDAATAIIIPDASGTYTITCDVDGTDYTLRITVTAVTVTSVANAHRFSPATNASIPSPALGETLFYSSTDSRLSIKNTSGSVKSLHSASRSNTAIDDTDSPYTVLSTDDVIGCDTSLGAITVTLPAVASSTSRHLIISDEGGNAGTLNITVDGNGAETIDGSATSVISTNYGSLHIYCNGSAWFSY